MNNSIRMMKSADLEFAAALTHAEGWSSQTRASFEDFLSYDPGGCFIAEVDGHRAGMCVATAYQQHGFIGMLIVAPEYRGGGLGTDLFNHAVQILIRSGMRTVSLDGDPPGIPIYQAAGFRKVFRSLRFNGSITGKLHPDICPMSLDDLEMVLSLDAELFKDDRSFFLRRKHHRHPELCFVAKQNGNPLGYLFATPGDGLISVGPWAALPELAHPLSLLEQMALSVPGERVRIGVLEISEAAVKQMREATGLLESEPSWRMILGDELGAGLSKQLYAIGSAAKG